MSEADAIGWDYSEEDMDKEERERTGNLNEFELMLEYHGLDEQDWQQESGNSQNRLWWNYRKLGKQST